MAKKSTETNEQLPGTTEGEGVAALQIEAVEKAITKYEKKKEARCQMSPGEIAAKDDLLHQLQAHRDKLHTHSDGRRFYRFDDGDGKLVDYFLEESLKRKKANSGDDSD